MILVPPGLSEAERLAKKGLVDALERASAAMAASDVECARAWLWLASRQATRIATLLEQAAGEVRDVP